MTHGLVELRGVGHAYGAAPLIEDAGLAIDAGERVVLVGRNGAGKSTLMGIVAGDVVPDAGEVRRDAGVRVGHLPQVAPAELDGSVRAVVAGALAEIGALVEAHARLAAEARDDPRALAELDGLQRRIEAAGGWDLERRVARTLSALALDGEASYASLSGGQRRRVLLARALAAAPDLLLLDEPTNHLDVAAIEWLEGLLGAWRGGILFTTHDRRLAEHVATRIVELDRGALTSWPGDWANYRRRRDERLAAEARAEARFDKRLSEEEVWIRQGIRARRTRDEGRVRRLHAMRRERAARRERAGNARFAAQAAAPSGRRVVEARAVRFAWNADPPVIDGLDVVVERGDRIGVVGPNGSGKTTLVRLLLGELAPSAGEIIEGTRLEVAYFDQHRTALDDDAALVDCVADGADHVVVDGERRHVVGYLRDFLFEPARARQPVRALSGGERARLALARLLARPANVIAMDEPTNDLDVETLELLEERLVEYPGTVIVASHDRAFLDNVVTSTLVLEGGGRVGEYVGGYSDWLRQRPAAPAADPPPAPRRAAASAPRERAPRARLGFNEQRELRALPERIEGLEAEIAELHARLADPALYREDGARVGEVRDRLADLEAELERTFERWSELEGLARAGPGG